MKLVITKANKTNSMWSKSDNDEYFCHDESADGRYIGKFFFDSEGTFKFSGLNSFTIIEMEEIIAEGKALLLNSLFPVSTYNFKEM